MEYLKVFEDFNSGYKLGDVFTNPVEKKLCQDLNKLRAWLHYDYNEELDEYGLGLKKVINSILEKDKIELENVLESYQKPLSYLSKVKGNPFVIKYEDDKYTHNSFLKHSIIKDDKGDYHYVNKLNTNYSDLSELLTHLFSTRNVLNKVTNKSTDELKEYLMSIKPYMKRLIEEYIKSDGLKEFTRNTVHMTETGDVAENKVCEVLEKNGMTKLYQGGNGDLIDMVFGVDLIMEDEDGEIITYQVKNKAYEVEKSIELGEYKRVSYLACPLYGGIAIFNHTEQIQRIDLNGVVKWDINN